MQRSSNNQLPRPVIKRLPTGIFVLFALFSCLEPEYEIDNLDQTMHILKEDVKLPLAVLQKQYFKDILGKDEALILDPATGQYDFHIESAPHTYVLEPFRSSVMDFQADIDKATRDVLVGAYEQDIAEISQVDVYGGTNSFEFDFPDFDFSQDVVADEIYHYEFSKENIGGMLEGIAIGDEAAFGSTIMTVTPRLEVGYIDKISRIHSVSLSDVSGGSAGCLITVMLDVQDLKHNGAISIDEYVTVTLPDRYKVGSHPSFPFEYGEPEKGDGYTIRSKNVQWLSNGVGVFKFYLTSIELSDLSPKPVGNGKSVVYMNDDIYFTFPFVLEVATKVLPRDLVRPVLEVSAQPVFKDAVFSVKEFDYSFSSSARLGDFWFGNIPNNVLNVYSLGFKSGENVLPVSTSTLRFGPYREAPDVKIKFPSQLTFDDSHHSAGEFLSSENAFSFPADRWMSGCELWVAGAAFTASSVPEARRRVKLPSDEKVEMSIKHTFAPTTDVKWSDMALQNDKVTMTRQQSWFDVDRAGSSILVAGKNKFIVPKVTQFPFRQQIRDIPRYVEHIDYISVAPVYDYDGNVQGDEGVRMDLDIEIINNAGVQGLIKGIVVSFPDFVDVVSGNNHSGENRFPVEEIAFDYGGVVIGKSYFTIKGFKDISIEDGMALLEGAIDVDFVVEFKGTELEGDGYVRVRPVIYIPKMKTVKATTSFDISFDNWLYDEDKTYDMSQIYSVLGIGSNKVSGMYPPAITINIDNPTGLVSDGVLSLTPRDKGDMPVLGNKRDIKIPFGVKPGKNRLYIAGREYAATPVGYTRVDFDLSQLFDKTPYTLDIGITGGKAKEGTYIVMSDQANVFSMSYSIDTPFVLNDSSNPNLFLENGSLTGKLEGLSNVELKFPELYLCIRTETNSPFAPSDAFITFQDNIQGDLDIKTVLKEIIEEPEVTPGVRVSTMVISVGLPNDGDLRTLASVDYISLLVPLIKYSQSDDYEGPNADDWFSASAWLVIPASTGFVP